MSFLYHYYYYKMNNNVKPSQTSKYKVYENDLKSPEYIDPDRSIWHSPEVQKKFLSKEVTTLEYRIEECKKNNYEYLDISYLNLEEIPNFTTHKDYEKLKNIKFLFANDNKIKSLENGLDQFLSLQVLDISSNNLKKIKKIPNTMIELMCHNNKLISICSSKYLLTLDCSYNKLKKINEYCSVKNLMCENNEIKELQTFENVVHLTIKNNPLEKMSTLPNVEFLNIDSTDLKGELPEMNSLKWLICHNTNIKGIHKLQKLEHIEMTNCSLIEIPYLKNLKDILCDLSANLMLDGRLKLKTYLIEREHAYYIFNN
jgi:hypothetical protein